MKFQVILGLAFVGALLAGCADKPTAMAPVGDTNPPISGSTNVQFYLVRGVFKKVDTEEKTATIQHEEIPNYMKAMTMPFNVKDTKELEKLQALQSGDTIWFRLWVSADESWIDKIAKEGRATQEQTQTNAPPQRESFRVARDVQPLEVGDLMPDYTFTNEMGRAVKLSSFKGRALAFTFIFTRCPLPDFCPRMTKNFFDVYKQLTSMPAAPTNWHLLSISFDPHYDTPAVLRTYGQVFQYDPKRWSLVTGAMIDIDAITDQFGLIIVKIGEEWDHKMRTVVVDAAGRIQKIFYGNDWKPEAVVEEIIKAAQVKESDPPAAKPATP